VNPFQNIESASPGMGVPPGWLILAALLVIVLWALWPTAEERRRWRARRAQRRVERILAAHRRAEDKRLNPPRVDHKTFLVPWLW